MSNWYQQALTPPEVVELRLRFGLIAERNHVQALVELVDPMTGIQIAQWSAPHVEADRMRDLWVEATTHAWRLLEEQTEPF
jgi:hypothetical protein